ncbi:hypothetical protein SPHINGOAX6_70246 [Sphingomonas sp. AX6]|nr:hypothetical protein SPHINGOAX6_70246 [Sphingomonas sp. AX6]
MNNNDKRNYSTRFRGWIGVNPDYFRFFAVRTLDRISKTFLHSPSGHAFRVRDFENIALTGGTGFRLRDDLCLA